MKTVKTLSDLNNELMIFENLVIKWGLDRNMFREATLTSQINKGMEEIGEVWKEYNKDRRELLLGEIGDAMVCHIICTRFQNRSISQVSNGNEKPEISDAQKFCNAIAFAFSKQKATKPEFTKQTLMESLYSSFLFKSFPDTLNKLAAFYGSNLGECLKLAYKKIEHRKGEFINGVYVKEDDLKTQG